MSGFIQSPVGDVIWADGSATAIPDIHIARNGWVMKPPQCPPGHGKLKNSFGRGYHGQGPANDWLNGYTREVFRAHNWEIPAVIGRPIKASHGSDHSSIMIGWDIKPFGWVNIRLSKYGHTEGCKWTFSCHGLVEYLREGRKGILSDLITQRVTHETLAKEYIVDAARDFLADPVLFITKRKTSSSSVVSPLLDFLGLKPGQFTNLDPSLEATNEYRLEIGESLLAYLTGKVEHYNKLHLDKLEHLFQIWSLQGIRVNVQRTYDYGFGKYVPASLNVTVPANDEHTEAHTIKITKDGLEVKCGYKEETEKVERYQQAQAFKIMHQFAADDFKFEDLQVNPEEFEATKPQDKESWTDISFRPQKD